jgi:hypothetical protein
LKGQLSGSLRYYIKKMFLNILPKFATFFFTYIGGLVVAQKNKVEVQ